MSIKSFIVKNLLRISPGTQAGTVAGELRVDSSDANKLKYHDGSTEDSVVLNTALSTVSTGLSNHLSDTADAHDASAISVVATGNLASTEVQAALQELQGDIDGINTALGTKVDEVVSTGDAIVRFDGIAGAVQDSDIQITDLGNLIPEADGTQSVGAPSNRFLNVYTDTVTNEADPVYIGDVTTTPSVIMDATTQVDIATGNTGRVVNIASGSGTNTVNIGGANTTINMTGTVNNQNVTNLNVTDKLVTLNDGGAAASGGGAGVEVEEDSVITGYVKVSGDRGDWEFKTPAAAGVISLTPGAGNDDIVLAAAQQTLSSKTLTTPTTDVITMDGQGSTPANPAAGYYKIYVKDSDGKARVLDSAGNETTLGAAGANTALSNLASTAVNADILPSATGTRNLGSASYRWASGYFDSNRVTTLYPNSGTGSVQLLAGGVFEMGLSAGAAVLGAQPLRWYESGNTYFTAFKAGTLSANTTYTLPTSDGSNGQALTTNGSATLSWVTPGSVSTVATKTNADSPYSASASDDVLLLNTSGGNITVNLPAAASNAGKVLRFIKTSASNTATLDGNSSETIHGQTTWIMYDNNENMAIICDGSNWRIYDYPVMPKIELHLDAGNGAGAVDTKIRRFSNTRSNTLGQYATYSDSANNACKVTINIPGKYYFQYLDNGNAGNDYAGISVNSSTLTTSISSVTYANGKRAISSGCASAAYGVFCSTTLDLVANDVVRPHFSAVTGTSDNIHFRCVLVSL